MWAKLRILILQLTLISLSGAIDYKFNMDEDGIFVPCEGQPGNPTNIDEALDMSKLHVSNSNGFLEVGGEVPVIWKGVQPGDTITLLGQIYRMERNTWQKAMFSASSRNFCRNMFEKGQYWHQFWTKYIINSDEIKSKCLNTPGAVIKMENYQVELRANLNVPSMDGRYKLVIMIEAFDKSHTKRPVSICTEIRGNIVRA
ncbi:uncharacterized protein LOC110189686 [Drosophila serrata]|uniref:uncharacterized protein LOC110189686 n=1 Tax=Drosophila serrata TaxID=7274 RepID=UPI000A1D0044|nr:uncharacterized protein LOC110189686 [Drosophila serrata]